MEPLRGPLAGPNPWGAPTLEWAAASPPEPYNFAEIPRVTSEYPLWDGSSAAGSCSTRGLDAAPEHRP